MSYVFQNERLLHRALTHASLHGEENNERLEFLGDTVLDLVAAEALFLALPEHREGDLSVAKSWLVSRKTLATAARRLGLAEQARFGGGLNGERPPLSVLANLYEAMLGAIFLDGGLEAARHFVLESLADELQEALAEGYVRNHKQRLQEWAQRNGGAPPAYRLLEQRGDADRRAFRMQAVIGNTHYPSAWGKSRKEAEHWAAQEALFEIEETAP